MTTPLNQLATHAHNAALKAHAPYSKFSVGAAIVTNKGTIYSGCNVENISSGLSICAERNAIASAVTQEGKFQIAEVYVTNINEEGKTVHCSPCGACRQVIAEFATPATKIHYMGSTELVTVTMEELLPDCFSF